MKNYNFHFEGKSYQRVTKRTFLKWFSETKEGHFCLCPSNMCPIGMWQVGHFTDIKRLKEKEDVNIQGYINTFECYNCSEETGLYASFYIVK